MHRVRPVAIMIQELLVLTSSPSIYGRFRLVARYLPTVLFPHPAGPVTSHMWCPPSDCCPLGWFPCESAGKGRRVAWGELDRDAFVVAMFVGDCPSRITGLSQESIVYAGELKGSKLVGRKYDLGGRVCRYECQKDAIAFCGLDVV